MQADSGFDLSNFLRVKDDFFICVSDQLGRGGFAKVYKGYDQKGKREIAVKKIANCNKPILKKLFSRQISLMDKLKHKNIIQCYDSTIIQSQGYLFLQLCLRENLKKQILKKLREEQTFRFFKQLVEGMSYMNSMGFLHRDLKPQNLLISLEGELKIADFGIARDIAENSSQLTQGLGTVFYWAPQIHEHAQYNQRCDVYSAGLILYEMLTCQTLYEKYLKKNQDWVLFLREQKQKGGWVIEHPSLFHKPYWLQLLKGMLKFDPRERFSFEQIKKKLTQIVPSTLRPIDRTASEEEQLISKKYVKKIEHYIYFRITQQNYLVNLLKILNEQQYKKSELIPSVYKILLLFVTLLNYGLNCNILMEEISQRQTRLVIGGESFEQIFKELMVEDKQKMNKFLDEKVRTVNLGKEQIKRYVTQQLLPKIDENMKEPKLKELKQILLTHFVMFSNLVKNVRLTGQGQSQSQFLTYRNLTQKLVSDLYQTSLQIQSLQVSDLKIYFILLVIKKYEAAFSWESQKKFNMPPQFTQVNLLPKNKLILAIEVLKSNQIINWKSLFSKKLKQYE